MAMKFNFPIRVANVDNLEDEVDVENGLALTPAQIAVATAKGRAVSLASLESMAYFDTQNDNLSPSDFPMEYGRGVDDNMCWAAAQEAKEKVKSFKRHMSHREQTILPS